MIIDAHHHLWDPRIRDYPWMAGLDAIDRPFIAADLAATLAGTGVTGTVVVQASATDEETDWLIGVADASDLIVGIVGWADLTGPAVHERLDELVERSALVRGIRHLVQDEADPDWLLRPEVSTGLAALQDVGLAYDLLVRQPQVAAAAVVAGRFPGLTLVVDHAAKPDIARGEWASWRAGLAAIAAHDNVYCKVSGLVTEASWTDWREQGIERYIAETIALFGPERCMFGSDWPVSLLAAPYAEVLELAERATARLSLAERDSVFRGAATEAYSLAAS